jgi:hypothetical protein
MGGVTVKTLHPIGGGKLFLAELVVIRNAKQVILGATSRKPDEAQRRVLAMSK